uniref:Uncharacterized protein n=1 Tax=Oryza barthii TaxID=65489 RepID=A0A0D3FPL2_9ORYZ
MERVPLLGDAFLSAPRQLFVGSHCVGAWGARGHGYRTCDFPFYPISPSTLDLIAGRRPTAVGKNPRRLQERERGDGDGDDGSTAATTAPPSPPLEAPVLATEDHEDDVVVVVAAVATSSALASSARWRERGESGGGGGGWGG